MGSCGGSKAIIPAALCVGEHNCVLNNTHRPTHVSTHTHMQTRPLKPLTCASVVLLKSARTPPHPHPPPSPVPHLANNLFFVLCTSFISHQLSPRSKLTDKSEQISCAFLQTGRGSIWGVDWAAGLKKNWIKKPFYLPVATLLSVFLWKFSHPLKRKTKAVI